MKKLLALPSHLRLALIALLSLTPMMIPSQITAGTCAERCSEAEIQFVPGQTITVQVKNRTQKPISIEKVQGTKPVLLGAGQTMQFERAGTIDNFSVVWDSNASPLRALVMQPNSRTLRIELGNGWSGISDRAVYLRNDGRIEVL